MIRSILIRYILPLVAAISLVAVVGVPYIDTILTRFIQADVAQRAKVTMASIQEPLSDYLARRDMVHALAYLGHVATDKRILGVTVCSKIGKRLLETPGVPAIVDCGTDEVPELGNNELVKTSSGPVEVSRFKLSTADGQSYRIVLVNDLSFIEHGQTTARNFLLASFVVAATFLAALGGLGIRLLVNHWVRILVGDISRRRFLDDAESPETSRPVLARVREVLRELEASQRLEIDFKENWTPQALRQVVRQQLESCLILIVSNREPYIHNRDETGQVKVQVPASGMVTALEPIMRACSGIWVAHGSGNADRDTVDRNDQLRVPPEEPSYTLHRVWLTPEDEEGYYYGFCNEGLWPLCHLAYVRPQFREADWQAYLRVNEKFARAVARDTAKTGGVILIQDFHFAPLPKLLRNLGLDVTIALFWHIPWPNAETFGVCPWKLELLRHMLAADILGFHTRHHCQNFLATVDRFVECQIDHEHMTVTHGGHVCRVSAYPISIEWPPRWLARVGNAQEARSRVRARLGLPPDSALGVGVERWDFTKGIVERLQSIEVLFTKYPAWCGRFTFLQVAAPSRSKLPAYQALQRQTLQEVERINARFATANWQPIILIGEQQDPEQVFELYRAADICLVNSLHDGMNLVAKEFVAAREDEDGVLILSTFAGASRELTEALLVNPFDVSETADAIVTALQMDREERRKRMQLMRRTVSENNVYRWAGRMLMDVATIRQRQSLNKLSRGS